MKGCFDLKLCHDELLCKNVLSQDWKYPQKHSYFCCCDQSMCNHNLTLEQALLEKYENISSSTYRHYSNKHLLFLLKFYNFTILKFVLILKFCSKCLNYKFISHKYSVRFLGLRFCKHFGEWFLAP